MELRNWPTLFNLKRYACFLKLDVFITQLMRNMEGSGWSNQALVLNLVTVLNLGTETMKVNLHHILTGMEKTINLIIHCGVKYLLKND